ncbi:MAG: hypothetical protein ACTSUN_10055 [Promethearchaeota archaeon]
MSALSGALKEIFEYYGLLDQIIEISLNRPEEYLDKVFRIFQEFVEMVQIIDSFDVVDVQSLLNNEFYKYFDKPFFPVFAGLFLNALLKRLFQNQDRISIDLEPHCLKIINNVSSNADVRAKSTTDDEEIGFSLDFIGYLLPKSKVLEIKGAVGDFLGALMNENSTIILNGKHGKYFGYEKDPTAKIIVNVR